MLLFIVEIITAQFILIAGYMSVLKIFAINNPEFLSLFNAAIFIAIIFMLFVFIINDKRNFVAYPAILLFMHLFYKALDYCDPMNISDGMKAMLVSAEKFPSIVFGFIPTHENYVMFVMVTALILSTIIILRFIYGISEAYRDIYNFEREIRLLKGGVK